MTDTTVNAPLLRKTLEWATDQWRRAKRGEDSEWAQGVWFHLPDWIEEVRAPTWRCGSACCIAGHVALDQGWLPALGSDVTVVRPAGLGHAVDSERVDHVAAQALGLSRAHGEYLFAGYNMIGDLWQIAHDLTGGAIELPADFATMPRRPGVTS